MTTEIDMLPEKQRIKKLSHRHKRVLDIMIRHPEMLMAEIAEAVNLSPAWVSTIVNSDLFQMELSRRRAAFEMIDNKALSAKLTRAAHIGLTKLVDHIEAEPAIDLETGLLDEGPSFQEIRQVTELALKSTGYLGGAKGNNIVINDNRKSQTINQVTVSTLERARQTLMQRNNKNNVDTPIEANILPAS